MRFFMRRVQKHCPHEFLEPCRRYLTQSREGLRNSDPADADGKYRQYHQRDRHHHSGFRCVFSRSGTRFSQEDQGDLACGVERCYKSRDRQHDKDHNVSDGKSTGKDLILRPESGCDQRETGKRETAGEGADPTAPAVRT